ncbi:hypothetical protein KEM60_00387 [Austwickia sp. TVS 96-490-7B]|uniref:hypothetical protein n=1 Tax=Austwickia sp. TVS 96-490-7B TaxID=2830843 RepID=UPI001C597396|nr:hypothetical protein [Austwickia sp. TVS 96-490-7B]MBW3084201.1 hypothetical protein [Austwickia sp. TVS 96-490-7B]
MNLLTTAQAAELVGVSPSSLRGLASRARQEGIELRAPAETWPDKRTPMYDKDKVTEWLAGRPGPGNRTRGENRRGSRPRQSE